MKVVHINDVARIGTHLVKEATMRGLDWHLLPIAQVDPKWQGATYRYIRRALRGFRWEIGLARATYNADLLNLHGGNIRQHTGWIKKPYVLHLHGSDVRTVRHQPKQGKIIDRAIAQAEQVYYTTPDLAEHTLPLRADAILQPIIVDIKEIPPVERIADGPLRIIFPSRWEEAKGGQKQVDLAVALRKKLGNKVILEGLDWGVFARQAATEAGVILRPKMSHSDYCQWLASGQVAVGQLTGVLGVSEVEALATQIPLAVPLHPDWYSGDHPSLKNIPVLGGIVPPEQAIECLVEAVANLLQEPRLMNTRSWVAAQHGPKVAVDRLLEQYQKL